MSANIPADTQQQLATKIRDARLSQAHSQLKAATLTGVPLSTLKKFERSGEISLRQFLMLLHVYGDLGQAMHLIPSALPTTIDALLDAKPKRQRGRS